MSSSSSSDGPGPPYSDELLLNAAIAHRIISVYKNPRSLTRLALKFVSDADGCPERLVMLLHQRRHLTELFLGSKLAAGAPTSGLGAELETYLREEGPALAEKLKTQSARVAAEAEALQRSNASRELVAAGPHQQAGCRPGDKGLPCSKLLMAKRLGTQPKPKPSLIMAFTLTE